MGEAISRALGLRSCYLSRFCEGKGCKMVCKRVRRGDIDEKRIKCVLDLSRNGLNGQLRYTCV